MSSFMGVHYVLQLRHICGLLPLPSSGTIVHSLYNELNRADIPLVMPSLPYIYIMLCHRVVGTIAHRLGTALAQMVGMSALCWMWWKDDCWRVVGDHTYVLPGLPCCGTSGYS